MLTVRTKKQILKFNLTNFTNEELFKEAALNHTIDQTGKKLRVRFRHADYLRTVKEFILDTKNILSINFEEKKYYENNMYYSIELNIQRRKYANK